MSHAMSISQGRPYGMARVCRIWKVSRSTQYARRSRMLSEGTPRPRGPRPSLSNEQVLAYTHEYLAHSPWKEEGHRKVYAWLRFVQGKKIGKSRVWRIMRDNGLLSPRRSPKGEEKKHEGRITTEQPDMLWGTDGFKVRTIDDGWVWGFLAVDHCHGELLGVHAAKKGDAFAALEPISSALKRLRGSVSLGIGHGISLRSDHGSQYISGKFYNQVKAWDMKPSMALVGEPQTNGVAERAVRTLKEQVVYGKVFKNAEDLRVAILKYQEMYNKLWRLEKNGYRTPNEVRARFVQAKVA
jgi:putative transposase